MEFASPSSMSISVEMAEMELLIGMERTRMFGRGRSRGRRPMAKDINRWRTKLARMAEGDVRMVIVWQKRALLCQEFNGTLKKNP